MVRVRPFSDVREVHFVLCRNGYLSCCRAQIARTSEGITALKRAIRCSSHRRRQAQNEPITDQTAEGALLTSMLRVGLAPETGMAPIGYPFHFESCRHPIPALAGGLPAPGN